MPTYTIPRDVIGLRALRSTFDQLERQLGPLPYARTLADDTGMETRLFAARALKPLVMARLTQAGVVVLRSGTELPTRGS